jgi:uncharacterized repeat protein (TIGR01451 family)
MNDLFESLPRIYFKIFLSVAKVGAIASLFTLVIPSMVWADGIYMTNMKTNLTQSSIDLLTDPSRTPGVQPGDIVEYVVQGTVAGDVGGPGVYFTAYIPDGVEVLGTSFVTDATGTTVRVPGLGGQANDGWGGRGLIPTFGNPFSGVGNSRQSDLYGDTGIFYSTDTRTQLFTTNTTTNIAKGPTGNPNGTGSTSNGYNVTDTFYGIIDAFNLWDADQVNAFGRGGGVATLNTIPTNISPTSSATIINPVGRGATPFGSGSVVAGPDTGYTKDNTGSTGPWNRIQYSGSKKADISDGAATGAGAANTATLIDASSIGRTLSDMTPLPNNTKAVRWSDGLRLLNEKVYIKIKVRINAPAIASPTGALLNFDATGSDNWASGSKDNPWRYFAATASQSANLFVTKEIYKVNGADYSGGNVPPGATITYRVRYVNLGNLPVNGITFKDTLPTAIATTGCTPVNPTLGSISNSVTVSSVTAGSSTCPSASATVTFGSLPNVTSGSLPALRGGEFTYDVKISTTTTNGTIIANNAVFAGQDIISNTAVNTASVASVVIGPVFDYGDAPDTYGTDKTPSNSSNTSDPVGANHIITAGLFLGATAPDVDANGFVDGIDNNTNATDDDAPKGTGTGNGDDEDNFTLPTLFARVPSYSIPANNITVTNTNTQPATLHAWIDFNKNGRFDSTEYASATVNPSTTGGHFVTDLTWSGINLGTVGDTYARFRLTSDSSINNTTPGGAASNGEVEDYRIAITPHPELLLVKRITAINPGQPGKEIQFSNFVNDPAVNDNHPLWPDPSVYLRGAIDAGNVKPDDEVEYTVYFLSSGDTNAKEVKICDVVPDQMTFVKNTYGIELGIGLGFDSTGLPLSPNLKLSNLLNDDQGDFYGAGTTPPTDLCKKVTPADTLVNVNGTNNDNGTVVVKIPNLPKADTPGNPMDSYGFIRFRGKVK